MKIDHIAIAVNDVEASAKIYQDALGIDEIEEQTWKYLKRIDKMGGSLKAIDKGFFQAEIRQNAYRL